MQTGVTNINVDLSQTDELKCDECGSAVFHPAFILRKVSAFLSPSGKDTIVPIQVFACDSCGNVNKEFLPIEKP